jgi:regulator of cell morphogenesis and NO signaling
LPKEENPPIGGLSIVGSGVKIRKRKFVPDSRHAMHDLNFSHHNAAQLQIDGAVATLSGAPTVRDLVAEKPRRARVFEKWGIPYCCCIGDTTLIQACRSRGVSPEVVAAEIAACDNDVFVARHSLDYWRSLPSVELVRHLQNDHFPQVRGNLARASYLVDRVAMKHGEIYPELWELQALFEEFKTQLENHLARQERSLFPLVKWLATADKTRAHNVIRVLRGELQFLAESLSTMRAWTQEFTAPATACNTYRVMIETLGELEEELSDDLHPEEELLFARVQEAMKIS